MQPAIITNHTRRYTAPNGRDDVSTLFVREETIAGLPMLRSAWEAEQKEAGLLLAGAKVLLGVSAPIHPVVNLTVADLPGAFEPVFTARRYLCPDRGPIARVEGLVCKPPSHVRFWAEEPIVSTFGDAFAAAIEQIEKRALDYGVQL